MGSAKVAEAYMPSPRIFSAFGMMPFFISKDIATKKLAFGVR